MNRPTFARVKSSPRRPKVRPILEALEDRQMLSTFGTLSATTTTATKDSSGAPWVFTLGGDGTVFYDQDRPTNNASNPYVFSGLQTLPGLKATSITSTVDAYSGSPGIGSGPAVFALTGAYSYVYEDRFVATGNPASPFAWTGWQPLGNFVASSIAATTPQYGSPTVFALGYDHHVYADNYYGPETSAPGTWSGFNVLSGLQATTIAATTDSYGNTYVLALTGPYSYIYGGQYIAEAPSYFGSPSFAFTGWTQTGGLVASALTAGIGSDAEPAYYATGYDGNLYEFEYTGGAFGSYNNYGWSRFQSLGTVANMPIAQVAETNVDGYFTMIALTGPGGPVSENQYVPSPIFYGTYTWTGWHALNSISATAIAATTNLSGTPPAFAAGIYGGLYTDTASYTGNISSPDTWSGWQADNSYYGYPVTSAEGFDGYPIIFTIGPDGSVYYDQETGPNFGTGVLPWTGFQKLDSIEATSIVATADVDGGVAVFAMAGSASYVFEDRISFTGNASFPVFSSGWQSLGTFVATAIAAMPAANGDGPTVFAIGADANVYMDQDIPTTSIPPTYSWTGFEQVTGPSPGPVTAISVTSDTTGGFCLFALTGALSYVYADFYDFGFTPSSDYEAEGYFWAGWQSVGDFVAGSIAATNQGGDPEVAIIGANGLPYQSSYVDFDNPDISNYWSGFTLLGGLPSHASAISATDAGGSATFAALTGSVSYAYDYQEPSFIPGWQSPGYFVAISLSVGVGSGGGPILMATGYDGRIYVNQAEYTGDSSNPYSYSGWTSLGALPLYF